MIFVCSLAEKYANKEGRSKLADAFLVEDDTDSSDDNEEISVARLSDADHSNKEAVEVGQFQFSFDDTETKIDPTNV